MQSDRTSQNYTLQNLIYKIKRLKKKLYSYGWNKQETITFILYQFLKLPEPNWHQPSKTVSFYQIKEKYQVDTSAAQIILSLQQIVPNLHSIEVLQYLHNVFQFNLLNYGFQIFQSSSQSGQHPYICKKIIKNQRPKRTKSFLYEDSPLNRKKIHCIQQKIEKGEQQKRQIKAEQKHAQVIIVRKRKHYSKVELQQTQKQIKRDQFQQN